MVPYVLKAEGVSSFRQPKQQQHHEYDRFQTSDRSIYYRFEL